MKKKTVLASISAAAIAAMALVGALAFWSATDSPAAADHSPSNLPEASQLAEYDLDSLEPITWQTVDDRLAEHDADPEDLQLCTITGEGAAVWADDNVSADPIGKLEAEVFTGEVQAVPCEPIEGTDIARAMLPARGGEGIAQAWGVLALENVKMSDDMPAMIEVDLDAGEMTLIDDGEEVLTTPITGGSGEAPTSLGLSYVQASFIDPSEEKTTGGVWGSPGTVPITMLGSFSLHADPGGDPARVHTAIHAWDGTPTTGCVGVADQDAYEKIVEVAEPGALVVIR